MSLDYYEKMYISNGMEELKLMRNKLANFTASLKDKEEYENYLNLLDQLKTVRSKILARGELDQEKMRKLNFRLLKANNCLALTKNQIQDIKKNVEGYLNKH